MFSLLFTGTFHLFTRAWAANFLQRAAKRGMQSDQTYKQTYELSDNTENKLILILTLSDRNTHIHTLPHTYSHTPSHKLTHSQLH